MVSREKKLFVAAERVWGGGLFFRRRPAEEIASYAFAVDPDFVQSPFVVRRSQCVRVVDSPSHRQAEASASREHVVDFDFVFRLLSCVL